MADFKEECKKLGFFSSHDKSQYLLLNGGSLKVRSDPEFREFYIDCLRRKLVCYVVERRTNVFKLFVDLDYSARNAMSFTDLTEIVNVFQTALRLMYPGKDDLTVVACTSACKVKNDGSIHSGVHLHYPSVLVTSEIAENIRGKIVQDLVERFGNIGWGDVYDKAVYITNGLRMKGSMKMTACKACLGGECSECGGSGRVSEDRVYWPRYAMDMHGVLDQTITDSFDNDIEKTIHATSIRSHATSPDEYIWQDVTEQDTGAKFSTDATTTTRIKGSSQPLCQVLQKFILSNFSKYREHGLMVTDIQFKTNETAPVLFARTNSKWCENKGAAHESSTVYFYVTPKIVQQRCFSQKTTNGKECSGYGSRPVDLPERLRKELFPEFQPSKCSKKSTKKAAPRVDTRKRVHPCFATYRRDDTSALLRYRF